MGRSQTLQVVARARQLSTTSNAYFSSEVIQSANEPISRSVGSFGQSQPNWLEHESDSYSSKRFTDRIHVSVQAGRGGPGGSTFGSPTRGRQRRPNGGNGGPGGNVIVQACSSVKSLAGLNHVHKAKTGGPGKGEKTAGAKGADCVIRVPLGTVVYRRDPEHFGARDERLLTEEAERPLPYTADALAEAQADDILREEGDRMLYSTDSEEDCVQLSSLAASNGEADLVARLGEEVADLVENDQTIVLAQGGDGGRGNAFIPRRRARQASQMEELMQAGPGERVQAYLEMRLMCDIGLVGAPNAGKSSLLRALTASAPKVASYPFTTLQPHLGTIQYEDCSSIIADIPGIIKGAANNKGLGHSFLRHISRAAALAYVVDASAIDKSNRPWHQLSWLQDELGRYNHKLLEKPAIVVANKIDLVKRPQITISALQRRTDLPVLPVSAWYPLLGLGSLIEKIRELTLLSGQIQY